MNYDRLCIRCMKEIPAGRNACPYCGFTEDQLNVPVYYLPPRTILNGRYLVGVVLGNGGFGITYVAWDMVLDRKVAIKEYFVGGSMYRNNQVSIRVSTGSLRQDQRVILHSNLARFEKEAKMLAGLSDLPGIVRVYDFFPENNTFYIVMEYLDGETLQTYVKNRGGRITLEEAFQKLKPVMKSLTDLHRMSILHRDISPDNMMVLRSGQVKLFDFGGAKDLEAGLTKDHSTVMLMKKGYSPLEQTSGPEHQGPWTDVYAMAATFYYCMCGEPPCDVYIRMQSPRNFRRPSEMGAAVTAAQEKVLMKGLEIPSQDRYQTMEAFSMALETSLSKPVPPRRVPWLRIILAGLGVSAAAIAVFLFIRKPQPQPPAPEVVADTDIQVGKEETVQTSAPEETVQTSAPEETAQTTVPEEAVETNAPERPAETTAPEEPAETTAPEKPAETNIPEETVQTAVPEVTEETAKTVETNLPEKKVLQPITLLISPEPDEEGYLPAEAAVLMVSGTASPSEELIVSAADMEVHIVSLDDGSWETVYDMTRLPEEEAFSITVNYAGEAGTEATGARITAKQRAQNPEGWEADKLTGYEGTYCIQGLHNVPLYIGEPGSSDEQEIYRRAAIYVDEAVLYEEEIWGHTVYCGMDGWVRLSDLYLAATEDYSIHAGDLCYANYDYWEGLAVRQAPDSKADEVIRIPFGTVFTVEELRDGWGRLTINGVSGWTNMNYMCSFTADQNYRVSSTNDGQIMLRTAPDDDGDPLQILENGTIVFISQFQDGWGFAYCGGDLTGWVKMCDMQLAPVQAAH